MNERKQEIEKPRPKQDRGMNLEFRNYLQENSYSETVA